MAEGQRLIFRVHAAQRMIERDISVGEVRDALRDAEVVEDYLDDQPYPSRLMLGWVNNRPLHLVVAYNREDRMVIIVTVYEPDPSQWEPDFKQRRPM